MNKKNEQNLIAELSTAIYQFLAHCDNEATPTICQFIQTENGKASIVQDIINLVAKQGHTIASAALEIERTFSPNTIAD